MQVKWLLPLLLLSSCDQSSVNVPTPESECFEIAPMADKLVNPIMYNKCTGESWILLRSAVYDEKGVATKDYEWAWYSVVRTQERNMVEGH